jgi:hypothetical protein
MSSISQRWKNIPATVRKPLVLFVGLLVVLASPFTGILPGPGGIPVFLIGIAILSTEFHWARRIRDWVLKWVHAAGHVWRQHKLIGTLAVVLAAIVIGGLSFYLFQAAKSAHIGFS